MSNIWHTKEKISVKEVGHNFFQFVFSSQEDKDRVRSGKTWSFDNQYLILRDWSENLEENSDSFNFVELWVQLLNVPFHWLSIATGRKIGNKFLKLTDILISESGSSKGRHIKILAEVNLNKPLIRGITIKLGDESCSVDFRYENLQGFCFYCCKIGHAERGCQQRKDDI
ncbi:hypothetical protein DH2020_003930 [Rehmannia glutinosa]|uniref:CCHC-type domain-containing protein n=1 Tax=Rehmannia glutinosa TaxID=99300 RepID=A0ABR0XN12_REHGL